MLTQGDSHKSGWPRLTTQPVQDIGFVCYSQDMRTWLSMAYILISAHLSMFQNF